MKKKTDVLYIIYEYIMSSQITKSANIHDVMGRKTKQYWENIFYKLNLKVLLFCFNVIIWDK